MLEAAGQLDKAQELYAKAGDTANAERVKALPRPEPVAKGPAGDDSSDEAHADEAPLPPPPAEVVEAPSPNAQ